MAPLEIAPDAQQLLKQLNDIIVPDAVGWLPPSAALMSLVIGLAGIIIGVVWALLSSHKANQYRRQAKNLFAEAIKQAATPQHKIEVANSLLKQVAITHYGRANVAMLAGQKWVEFLKTTANYIEQPKYLKQYLNAHYQDNFDFEENKLNAVLNYAKSWIKGHHK